MRVLYCAIDQEVPGTRGGSTHVVAVARGLAALGHDVHVAAAPGIDGFGTVDAPGVTWHAVRPPFGASQLRLARAPAIGALARRLHPDVVIERYHNFGGEGLCAARSVDALGVLEVNAPVIDYPGSPKQRLDRALLFEPLRRWRDWQCRQAGLIVTPSADILPASVPADRVLAIEWGADTDRFRPDAPGPPAFGRGDDEIVTVFAGAFRSWHGAHQLAHAVARLQARGYRAFRAVFVGDGPELPRVRAAAEGTAGTVFTGALPHDRMPATLAAADIGVAPFDVGAHEPLRLAFYWSPLKIFEYMAAGLPVVTPRIDRLAALVAHGREAVLYDADVPEALAEALLLLRDGAVRRAMGRAARARVEAEYSWAAHCTHLESAIQRRLDARRSSSCP